MLSNVGSVDRRACQLPAAVERERELAQLEGRHGQRADQKAQERLAGLGEAAAMRVLRRIGESRQTVHNLSAYIQFMAKAKLEDSECAAAGSGSVVTSRSGDDVLGTVNHHVHISFDLPNHNHAIVEARSAACSTPYGCQFSHHLVGTGSPVRHAVFSPPRMASTPTAVQNITNSMSQLGGPSRTIGFETPPGMKPAKPLANANELPATVGNQMAALGELEFAKIFLIYVYLAGNKIENVHELHEEYIRALCPPPMDDFESEIWHKFGHKFIPESERRENLDWDPMKTKMYHCYIDKRDKSIVTIFKGPYFENAKNHLQKVVGDDNILVVKFPEMPGHRNVDDYFATYRQIVEEGIILGLRRYRFLIKHFASRDSISYWQLEASRFTNLGSIFTAQDVLMNLMMLYHAKEFDESPRKRNEVFVEACLIYQIVYEYAIWKGNVSLCGFAWKVAGRALCQLHAIKRGGETVLCSQSVLRDAFKKNR